MNDMPFFPCQSWCPISSTHDIQDLQKGRFSKEETLPPYLSVMCLIGTAVAESACWLPGGCPWTAMLHYVLFTLSLVCTHL